MQIDLASFAGPGMLLILSLALICVAAVALVTVFSARRETQTVARLARERTRKMSELLRTMGMAEKIAGLGIWQYDPITGAQQWSPGMREMFGVRHSDPLVEGDAETLLYANDVDLIGNVAKRANVDGPYTLSFDIHSYDGGMRTLRVEACNLRGRSGAISRVVAVLRDVTDEKERVRELEKSRLIAVKEANHARNLADTDALTGLANRRRVMAKLDHLVVAARKKQHSLVLVIFDIDHFKSVNDTYGHPQGDKVLKRVARIASQQARDGDLVGRVGGEEFVWIVPGASRQFASTMTERLRQAIAAGSAVGDVPPVTISMGYADLMDDDTSLTLFARADEALYDAKNSGRNKVCMAA